MLEIRNVSKTYRAKSGVSVRALDRVSLTLPERGMVFLLGKSGSGKSTLLNVLGGLDTFDADGGEVIIKGKSSRDFRRSDFDAYRNTFVGFVFQEYNILDEFTVGANIALALQLQGKRADNAAINALLEQVDLAGYGHRKPNELSGGQKQRIAIARALIKNPEIIMADEPTGALDSTTGEQVFETLKKLSEEKLVIVVSHDRDFAERFGDRIIELSDGHIISDMTLTRGGGSVAGIVTVGEDMIRIRRGYTLTAEDLAMINAYLAKGDRDVILSKNEKLNGEVCAAAGIPDDAGATQQRPTGKVETRTYDPAETKFIRSHLPLRNAFRMGAGGMKHRPVRLIFTILLSFIAFALFGLADTMAAYDPNTTVVDSIADSSMQALAVSVKLRSEYTSYDENGKPGSTSVEYYKSDGLSEEDLRLLEERTGRKFYPVYNGSASASSSLPLEDTILNSGALRNAVGGTFWSEHGFYGYIEISEDVARELGAVRIAGDFPTSVGDIMITKYHFDMWKQGGMILADGTQLPAGQVTEESILGQTITVYAYDGDSKSRNFRIVGILDTGLSTAGYEALLPDYTGAKPASKTQDALEKRLANEISYSFHALIMGAPGLLDTFPKTVSGRENNTPGIYFYAGSGSACLTEVRKDGSDRGITLRVDRVASSADAAGLDMLWLRAGKNAMGDEDLVLPISALFSLTTQDLGLTSAYPSATNLIPALENDVSGNDYRYFFEHRDELYETYNSRVPTAPLASPEAFIALVTERMNARFGVAYATEDWEWLLRDTYCTFRENTDDGQTNRQIALTCFLSSTGNGFPYDESLDYFRFADAQFEAFAAKAAADSPFRTFLNQYRKLTAPDGEYRVLTSDDAGYRGYLAASAVLYLRGAATGNYPAGAADLAWAQAYPEIGLDACDAARYARYADAVGIALTPEMWNVLYEGDGRGTSWSVAGVLWALHGESDGGMDLYALFRFAAAAAFARENDDIVSAALEDAKNPFTQYIIERTQSYTYEGDQQVPQLPAGRTEPLRRFFWAVMYLLDADTEKYGGAFGINLTAATGAYGEDYLAERLARLPELTMDFVLQKEGNHGSSVYEPIAGLVGMKVTGYYRSSALSYGGGMIFSDRMYAEAKRRQEEQNAGYGGDLGYGQEKIGNHDGGRYAFALMSMRGVSRDTLRTMTEMHYDTTGDFGFRMVNDVVETMDNWGETISLLTRVFLWVGLGFALFAALMMLNFVSATVTDKKHEIGILRAVGARAADVFLIFFTEAFVVAMINFVLAGIATGVATVYINLALRQELGFSLTLLHFGLRQVGLIFAVSLAVALIGTLLPASKIARKTPVDAMRDK